MADIFDYFYTSRLISAELDSSLSDFFDENIDTSLGRELKGFMEEWCNKAAYVKEYDGKYTFENFIWYILSDVDKTEAAIPRKEYFEMRRQRKKYFVSCIKKEKSSGFKDGVLAQTADTYFFLMRTSSADMKHYSSREEYLEEKYLQVMNWGKDNQSNLISYPYIHNVSEKRAAKCFLYDCAFRVYDLILHDYYGNVVSGVISKFPSFINNGIFSLQPKDKNLKVEVLEDQIQAYDEIVYTKDNGNSEIIRTVTDSVYGDFSQISEENTENALIESLVNKGKISLHNNVLDSTDKALFGMIYSSFNVEDINKGTKSINLLQLVKSVYDTPRKSGYLSIIEHLERMSKYRIDMRTTNSRGDFIRGGSISFFDIIFQIPQNDDSEATYNEFSITDGHSEESFLDAIKTCSDLSGIQVDVMPSKYIKDAMRSNMNYSILTRLYSKDMPVKVKSLLMLLTSERTDIYPKSKCSLPYAFFIEKLRMTDLKKSALVKQLREMLFYLKDNDILVSDFDMGTYTVDIAFVPIDETERILYKLDDRRGFAELSD